MLEKPSGLPTTAPPGGRECLVDLARRIDPDAPRLHASSRLDAEVSGVVVFARTEQATRTLLAARRAGRYLRRYVALASGAPSPPAGEWDVPIAIDPRDKRRRIAGDGRGAREARTLYATVAAVDGAALLLLFPQTGRTHQLRVHAAHAGVPLLGDTLYGGPKRIVRPDGRVLTSRRVMLHCAEVTIPDPSRSEPTLTFHSPLPHDMRQIWRALGGREPDGLAATVALLGERDIVEHVAQRHRVAAIDLDAYPIERAVLDLLSRDACERHRIIPVDRTPGGLIVAMADPTDLRAIDDIKFLTGLNVEPALALEQTILRAIERCYPPEH